MTFTLGSPLWVPALVLALVAMGWLALTIRRVRSQPRRVYDPQAAWLRAMTYFCAAWALGLATGAASTIANNPLVFPGQPHDPWWVAMTALCLVVVIVGYWIVWPLGTQAHGRTRVFPDTYIFGVLWGVSEGMIFASVWTLAVRWIGRDTVWEKFAVFLVCYVVLSLFIGLWHAGYWDRVVAPEHNILEWNVRKVAIAHVPNVIVTTAYVTLFANLGFYVGLQALALLGASLAMPFPSFRRPNPSYDPDGPDLRDMKGTVCLVLADGSEWLEGACLDLENMGAKVQRDAESLERVPDVVIADLRGDHRDSVLRAARQALTESNREAGPTSPSRVVLIDNGADTARLWADELATRAVTVNAMSEGTKVGASDAPSQRVTPSRGARFFSTILQSNEDPARTCVLLAAGRELDAVTGTYWKNSEPVAVG